jgi:hypothetical protein
VIRMNSTISKEPIILTFRLDTISSTVQAKNSVSRMIKESIGPDHRGPEGTEKLRNTTLRIRVKSTSKELDNDEDEYEAEDEEIDTTKVTKALSMQKSMKVFLAEFKHHQDDDTDHTLHRTKSSTEHSGQKSMKAIETEAEKDEKSIGMLTATKATKGGHRHTHRKRRSTTSEVNNQPIVCSNCNADSTTQWRYLDEGRTLCNRCGLWSMKHEGEMRPLDRPDIVRSVRKHTSMSEDEESSDGGNGAKKHKLTGNAVHSEDEGPDDGTWSHRLSCGINRDIVVIGVEEAKLFPVKDGEVVPVTSRKRKSSQMDGSDDLNGEDAKKSPRLNKRVAVPTRSSPRVKKERRET